jgi:hypothetical protein
MLRLVCPCVLWFALKQTSTAGLYGVGGTSSAASDVRTDCGDGNSSQTTFVHDRVDALLGLSTRVAHFSHRFRSAGVYAVKVRFCCRASNVLNNGGADVVLETSVVIAPGWVLSKRCCVSFVNDVHELTHVLSPSVSQSPLFTAYDGP